MLQIRFEAAANVQVCSTNEGSRRGWGTWSTVADNERWMFCLVMRRKLEENLMQ